MVRAGDRLRTDSAAQVTVSLFDGSLLLLYANSEIQVLRLAASRFTPQQAFIELAVQQGMVQMDVAPLESASRIVRIVIPQGSLLLREGSYTIRVTGDRAQVRVMEYGEAEVYAAQQVFRLNGGERIEVGPAGVVGPLVAPEELIFNGDFSQEMQGWEVQQAAGFPEGGDVPGQHILVREESRNSVLFSRLGSKNTHFETQLVQRINRGVTEFKELRLSLDLQLRYQSLSGGGYMGSEYPIRIRIDYQTADADAFVVYGFYYHNNARNRTDYGTVVPKDSWVSYTVPQNLMTLTPRPQRILSIQISASGWDLESRVSNASLAAQ